MATDQASFRTLVEEAPADDEWLGLLERNIEEVAPPATNLKVGDETHKGDGTDYSPGDVSVSDLEFKGYVEVWDSKTGVKSTVPRWIMWQTMQATRSDGSRVFTLKEPKITPSYGDDLCCYLHPRSPLHDRLVGMGYPECRKQHIPNRSALEMHCRKSHKNMWAFHEKDEADRYREEDRQRHREMMDAMTRAAIQGINLSAITGTTATAELDRPVRAITVTCEKCGKEFYGESKRRANVKLAGHKRYCDKK